RRRQRQLDSHLEECVVCQATELRAARADRIYRAIAGVGTAADRPVVAPPIAPLERDTAPVGGNGARATAAAAGVAAGAAPANGGAAAAAASSSATERPVTSPLPELGSASREQYRRRRVVAGGIGVAAVAAVALLIVVLSNNSSSPTNVPSAAIPTATSPVV